MNTIKRNVHESNRIFYLNTVIERISDHDALLQVAEESNEFAQACLKLIRAEKQTNPTPVTPEEALQACREELADLINAIDVAGIEPADIEYQEAKAERWAYRMQDAEDAARRKKAGSDDKH